MKTKIIMKLTSFDNTKRQKALLVAGGLEGICNVEWERESNQITVIGEGMDALAAISLLKRKVKDIILVSMNNDVQRCRNDRSREENSRLLDDEERRNQWVYNGGLNDHGRRIQNRAFGIEF
ncbi:hypothetical protein ACHQM5_003067 [Ranunculus cassubicifolius]